MLDVPTDDLVEEGENDEEHKEDTEQNATSKELGDLDMPPSWYVRIIRINL